MNPCETKHGIGQRKIPEKPVKCKQCELEFKSYKGLWTHMLKVQKIFYSILMIEWTVPRFYITGGNSLNGKGYDVCSSLHFSRSLVSILIGREKLNTCQSDIVRPPRQPFPD